MSKPVRTQPDLADIVALARALERDEQRTTRELRERESRLARELPETSDDRVLVALGWLEAIEGEDEAVRTAHQRAHMALQVTGVVIAIAAALVGWAATLGAFYFDGTGRVNAVAVLAVMVGVPGLLLVPFFVATLPPAVTRRLPGASTIAAFARTFSPGRLGQWVWRRMTREAGERTALVLERAKKHQSVYSGVQTWALLQWSQWFALWFQITALVASLVLVVFTDLAFGWSTTLTTGDAALDARRVHRVTSALATPWRWLAPEAEPSLELIEESRYFRVASVPVSTAQAARLGGWWEFVVCTIAVYGALPRVFTLILARARLRAAIRASVIAAPGFSAVMRRLHAARVETVAVEPEVEDSNASSIERPGQALSRATGAVRAVVNWSAVPVNGLVAFPQAQLLTAGGKATVDEDAAIIEQLGATSTTSKGDLVILVKGWEPPLMEFVDFLKALRAKLSGESAEIIVLPVGLDSSETGLAPATPSQLKLWRDKLARIGDPSLRVAADREEVVA
jgi:hypothetical protein